MLCFFTVSFFKVVLIMNSNLIFFEKNILHVESSLPKGLDDTNTFDESSKDLQ